MSTREELAVELKAAVQRGAAWLDEHYPDWLSYMDMESFDIGESCRCVLGQATDGFYADDTKTKLCGDRFDADMLLDVRVLYGFDAPTRDQCIVDLPLYYDVLQEAWEEFINDRRQAEMENA